MKLKIDMEEIETNISTIKDHHSSVFVIIT